MDEGLLMKLSTFVVYNLRMCMKKDYPCPNYFKGDNSREMISSADILCDLTHSSSFSLDLTEIKVNVLWHQTVLSAQYCIFTLHNLVHV